MRLMKLMRTGREKSPLARLARTQFEQGSLDRESVTRRAPSKL